MDPLGEVAGLRDGPQQVRLHQCDVVELRGAGGAGLGSARVQEDLPGGQKNTRRMSEGRLMGKSLLATEGTERSTSCLGF